jgi:hypothetical protein
MTDHPYKHVPERSLWHKRGTSIDTGLISKNDPIINVGDRVVSAGSCFAANIAPHIERRGFNYLRMEKSPADEAFGYGKFSAAYGHIYTARQLLQLLRRALGTFVPAETAWESPDGFVDPFRPMLRHKASSIRELQALTAQHLRKTRQAFEQADVFIFTLGLTEAWEAVADGSVFPMCPGTKEGTFDPARYRFRNFTVAEVVDDMTQFITELRAINPTVRILLTVSPVPLQATATGEHVLVATTYSKSVLRVAAEQLASVIENVRYFPSYEIITGPHAPMEFFESDRRNVSTFGVDSVMRVFLASCESNGEFDNTEPAAPNAPPQETLSEMVARVECEEGLLGRD